MKLACGFPKPRSTAPETKRSRCWSISARIFLPIARRKQIGFAERIAGQLLGDLHHLFLVDDDALRLLHQMIDLRMDRRDLLFAMLARVIGGDVLHRTRTVKRDQRNDILDAVRPHADQGLAHAGAFHLEHADDFAAGQHRVGVGIVERDLRQIDVDSAPADQLHRRLDHSQRLQTEEVELHKAGLFDILHVELGDRHVRARIAIHRNKLRQWPVANDDAGRVSRGMAVEAFQLLRNVEQRLDDRLLLRLLGKARLTLDRLGQVILDWPGSAAPSCKDGRPGHTASGARGRHRAARRAPAAFRR